MFHQDPGAHVNHRFGIRVFQLPIGELSVSTNPVRAPDIPFSSSQFRKQRLRHEKAVSGTSLEGAIYAWPCESISGGRVDSPHSRPYQGIWN
ncbi:unnamed protein product [Schistosoma mattheei]|uniref:Uncharacterized protein n=1 Tax=Schistosoma mattheei TaxID=31246 RepID=A0A3P8FSV0_9TREM|nr:unnamed protein product [Schistosoma mattheei]